MNVHRDLITVENTFSSKLLGGAPPHSGRALMPVGGWEDRAATLGLPTNRDLWWELRAQWEAQVTALDGS